MPDDKPAVDPVAVLLGPGDHSPLVDNKAVAAGLVGLVYLARSAFEERRRKQCLEATNAILKIEPEHEEARTIQASVRSELDQEFATVQELVREARLENDPVLFARASGTLRKIVEADSDNLEAQALLRETVAFSYFCPPPAAQPRWRGKRGLIVVGSFAVVVLVGTVALLNGKTRQASASLPASPAISTENQTTPHEERLDALDPRFGLRTPADSRPASTSGLLRPVGNEPTPPAVPPRASLVSATAPSLKVIAPAPLPGDVAVPLVGALAVNAAVPAEIYRGDEHLGSTPATLQLPAGLQTLEYRYQGLRQTVTHAITGQETTTAIIAFPIKVQINSRPWAQVFIDGARLTPLGQTPLGDVSIPIGSVLVFQKPGFPDKRYRVTAKDAAIQMTFP